MPTQLLHKGLTAPAKATPARAVKLAPEGLVTAIVAVTGVTDAVNDLIVPGAFKATLAIRRPKVVDSHEWKNSTGRVLHVEEWMPGDRRLPKRTKDGKPWPKEAGALVATMQYNLNSERGRESFEWVRFYTESNESEFSIGYKVPDGKARQRRDGVRVILQVDLFEFSHVLFGAAPLSMALDVKSLHGGSAGQVTVPALTGGDDTDDDYTDEPATNPDRPWDDDEKKSAGMEAKTAYDVLMEAKSSAAWDHNSGNARHLIDWYDEGAQGEIGWGTDGDFMRCVGIASKHMTPEQARGFCNLRHHDALGIYPATHAKLEGKADTPTLPGEGDRFPIGNVADLENAVKAYGRAKDADKPRVKRWIIRRARELNAVGKLPDSWNVTEGKSADQEVKSMPGSSMKGSFEERSQMIEKAVQDLLGGGGDDDGAGGSAWVRIVATFPAEVIVTVCKDGGDESYLIPYQLGDSDGDADADAVGLGEPQPVELSLVASMEGPVAQEAGEDVQDVTVVAPMLAALDSTAKIAALETKVGRAIRERLVSITEGLAGKSAADKPDPDADADTDTTAAGDTDQDAAAQATDTAPAAESTQTDAATYTREHLPEGDWQSFRKTEPIEAVHMDGPFQVETREGVVSSDGGWLAVDSEGYPYPIADDEMNSVYEPDTDPAPQANPEETTPGDVATDTQDPTSELADNTETKGAVEERVKLDPDEHFATMDALSDDEGALGRV